MFVIREWENCWEVGGGSGVDGGNAFQKKKKTVEKEIVKETKDGG